MALAEEIRKICHDLATPLAVIQGFIRSMESSGVAPENGAMLEAARLSLDKLKGLIDQLHQLAKSHS